MSLPPAVAIVLINLRTSAKRIDKPIAHVYGVGEPAFARSMGALLGPALLGGNRVTALYNGVRIFPSMLEAIASARRSVLSETYIYWSGSVGRQFADALVDRARAGVRVHVILDWVGSAKVDHATIQEMLDVGVDVVRYPAAALVCAQGDELTAPIESSWL